jgi:hypothetical protein
LDGMLLCPEEFTRFTTMGSWYLMVNNLPG